MANINSAIFHGNRLTNVGLLSIFYMLIAGAAMPDNDDLIKKYETGGKTFKRYEIGDKIVYFHQRMIGEAIVEKDFINYQFDRNTKKLIKKMMHWRDGLPDHVDIKITKKLAESMVEGKVEYSELYIISPESDVFPLDPPPDDPCWVVRSISSSNAVITMIDAMTGKIVGYGIPPPTR